MKKISADQFVLDLINKEFEIIESGLHWNSINELKVWTENNPLWFNVYTMTTEQYNLLRDYFMEHFYDWKPKRVSKATAQNEWGWFALSFGLRVKDNVGN